MLTTLEEFFNNFFAGKNAPSPQNNSEIPAYFKNHYEQNIRAVRDSLEAQRFVLLSSLQQRLICSLVFIVIAIMLLLWFKPFEDPAEYRIEDRILPILGVVMLPVYWVLQPSRQYKASLKKLIFPRIFSYFGDEWVYRETTGLKFINPYLDTELLPSYHQATFIDFLSGTYKSVPLSLVQCELTQNTHDNKTETVFQGILVKLGVLKRFYGETRIVRDGGSISNWLSKKTNWHLERVKLEDIRFEKRFEVYSTDQVEARYLLTTSFMERLVELEDFFNLKTGERVNLKCAFQDGDLYLVITTEKEWFPIGSLFKPVDLISEINMILKELELLFSIVDILKLDDKTRL
jgi:hypothetical protein